MVRIFSLRFRLNGERVWAAFSANMGNEEVTPRHFSKQKFAGYWFVFIEIATIAELLSPFL